MTDAIARSDHLRQPWQSTLRAYVALTKPRIIELLLVTTIPAMVLADRRVPDPSLLLGTLAEHAHSGEREHVQLLLRPGHRRAHAAYVPAP